MHALGICIAMEGRLTHGHDKDEYNDTITKLTETNSATVVVLFCSERVLVTLLGEMHKKVKNFEKMQFVSSEPLRSARLVGFWDVKVGFMYIGPTTKSVREFEEYFWNLDTVENKWTSWFKQAMNCSLIHEEFVCNSSETLGTKHTLLIQPGDFSGRVIDAVYAFAYALHAITGNSCVNDTTLKCNSRRQVSGDKLLRAIRNVSFESLTGRQVRFNKDGDVPVGEYAMYYLQNNTENGFRYVKMGEWKIGRRFNFPKLLTRKFASVKSRCSEPCGAYKIQTRIHGKPSCCWTCEYCPRDSLLLNKTHCQACQKGFLPNRNRDACIEIEPIYYGVGKGVSILLVVPPLFLSALGFFAIGFIVCVFVKFNNTALVKASSRELSSLLLVGLFLSYLFPLVCILKPSAFKCFSEFVLDSLPMTILYVAIAVKTNRVFRIFDENRQFANSLLFIRPLSQILLSLPLILFQVLLLCVLVYHDFPTKKLVYVSTTEVHLVCSTSDNRFFLSHLYNYILVAVCTYYSYRARNIPSNFNETKYIAFAMYGSCVMVLAFLVVSFVIISQHFGDIHKTAVRCYSVVLSSTVVVTCFFAPKLRLILCGPKDNDASVLSIEMDEFRYHIVILVV